MTDFSSLNLVLANLVNYFTGTYALLGLFICFIALLVILSRDIDFRFASLFVLPLLGLFVAIGWFGSVDKAEWIVNTLLVVIGVFYGMAVIKFMS